ncbi:MAG: Cytochrome [Mycobacterium sp.]|nr:Cytochrome [Mycobacterium sp.]
MTANPCEFDPYDPAVIADPYPVYDELRPLHPAAYNAELDCWFLLRFADVLAAASDPLRFTSAHGIDIGQSRSNPARNIFTLDNPEHDQLRSVVSRRFTPRAIAAFEPRVRALAREHLEGFVGRGHCELMAELAIPLPIIVVGDLLGVPAADRLQFREWADSLVHQDPRLEASVDHAREAGLAVAGYFAAAVEERRAAPADDLLSDLLVTQVNGRPMTTAEIVGFAFALIVAGTETTTNLIGNALLALAAFPDQRQLLAERPELTSAAIEEVFRYDAPVQGLARVTTEAVAIGADVIPAGARVQLRYGAANRDPERYGEPGRFWIERPAPAGIRHLALGHGIHFCLGAALARLEGGIVLEEFMRAIPHWEIGELTRRTSAEVRGPETLHLEFRA